MRKLHSVEIINLCKGDSTIMLAHFDNGGGYLLYEDGDELGDISESVIQHLLIKERLILHYKGSGLCDHVTYYKINEENCDFIWNIDLNVVSL